MPTNVTPTVGPWVTPLQIPSDGEGISSASVLAYVQEIANRLELIRNRVPGLTASGSPIRILTPAHDAAFDSAVTWGRSASSPGTLLVLSQLALSSTSPIYFALKTVPGQVIRSINVVLRGAGGHAALPATPPAISLVAADLTAAIGGALDPNYTTVAGPQVDTSANTAAYQLTHAISLSGLSITVNANTLYAVRLAGEAGANGLIGMRVMSASAEVSA